ncbi:MAG: hypothetical protein AABM67_21900 [Acidobacteriota bacterium]
MSVITLLLLHTCLVAQTLNEKLSARVDFVPSNAPVNEQLIEIAQRYRIPMGVEWFWEANDRSRISASPRQTTVIGLIRTVVQQTPGYTVETAKGIVLIKHVSFSESPLNFLNLRLSELKAENLNVFGAEWQLRVAINRTLHPELYAKGSNGGYGYGHDRDDNFDVENISFSGRRMTVREVLNIIVKQNGNALWTVEFDTANLMKEEPFFRQRSYGSNVDTRFAWRIIPLSHLSPNPK